MATRKRPPSPPSPPTDDNQTPRDKAASLSQAMQIIDVDTSSRHHDGCTCTEEEKQVLGQAVWTLNHLLPRVQFNGRLLYFTLLTAVQLLHESATAEQQELIEGNVRNLLLTLYEQPAATPARVVND